MKKSEQYHLARLAVLTCEDLDDEKKLEILATLGEEESYEKRCEDREAENAKQEDTTT